MQNPAGAPPNPVIRAEAPSDADAIDAVHIAAFATEPHSRQTEHLIVRALRAAGALTLSLVAEVGGRVVGHVAASPVELSDGTLGWHGVGPLGVLPAWQRRGVGSALMRALIAQLQALGSSGCVLVGEPAYYQRFGFRSGQGLSWPGLPAGYEAYMQGLSFGGPVPVADVWHHPAFEVTAQG